MIGSAIPSGCAAEPLQLGKASCSLSCHKGCGQVSPDRLPSPDKVMRDDCACNRVFIFMRLQYVYSFCSTCCILGICKHRSANLYLSILQSCSVYICSIRAVSVVAL